MNSSDQIAQDRQQETITENYWNNFNKEMPEQPYAKEGEGKKVSEIVKNLIAKSGGTALYYNHQIEWDMDLGEAREAASIDCIVPFDWDEPVTSIEQIDVTGRNLGHEYEITVMVYDS